MTAEPDQPDLPPTDGAPVHPGGADAVAPTPPKTTRKLPAHSTPNAKQVEKELAVLGLERAKADVADKKADVKDKEDKLKQASRDHLLLLIFRSVLGVAGLAIVVWWQFRILDLVERQGTKSLDISTPVMLALVTTTTANVFGFLLIVYRFVFPPPPKLERSPRKSKRTE